ncbi:MAG: hypothetical protein SFX73_36270 [Kofleriaceae bacterium]|nr:hypothetical protein [Kofleriaceae bacterium]
MTAAEVEQMRRDARHALEAQKDPARARALALRATEMLAVMEATPEKEADLHAGLAALWSDLDDAERAEPLIVRALELEEGFVPRRLVIFGTRHLFYAKFLFDRRRVSEAATHARDGLAIYAAGVPVGDRELAYLRRLMAPILRAKIPKPS